MRNLSTLLVQLVLAALVGYGAARFAVSDAIRNVPAAPPEQSATRNGRPIEPAPPPPSIAPAGAVTTQATAAALSVSYRSAVERAAPSVLTVHSARTAASRPAWPRWAETPRPRDSGPAC